MGQNIAQIIGFVSISLGLYFPATKFNLIKPAAIASWTLWYANALCFLFSAEMRNHG